MKRFAALLVVAFAPWCLTAQPPLRTYTHPACRYSFEILAAWGVESTNDPEHPCEVRAQAPDGSVVVWADAGRGGFEGALSAIGFVRVDDAVKGWSKKPDLVDGAILAFGRDDKITETSEIHVPPLHGLRANEVRIECYGQPLGGRLCSRDLAFLTNGRQWVSFESPAHSDWLDVALKSAVVRPPPLATYTHPKCGYSFQYLADSKVTSSGEDGDCEVMVQAPDAGPLHVDTGDGGFEEGADEELMLRVTEGMDISGGRPAPPIGSWICFGKGTWKPAVKIESGGLRGLRADDVPYRIHNEHGNAGMVRESRSLLTNDHRWVTVHGDASENFDVILETLRLSP